jgi:RNA polymerase sigma factor (sigma-70 family)
VNALTELEEALITDSGAWLAAVVRKFIARMPEHADRDAVRGAAAEGLVRAALAFDVSRGLHFTTYAYVRVWGAMQDECRQHDPLTRSARKAGETHETVSLEQPHGEGLTVADAIADLGTDLADAACERLAAHEALDALPPRHRRLVLQHAAGYTLDEIAAAEGVTDSRVSQIVNDAARRMRRDTEVA